MEDIDRYIIEAMRVRRCIVVYSELFESPDNISVLTKAAGQAFSVIQRSMHDDVVISLSRLFDTDCYKLRNKKLEYLSQRNIVLKYKDKLSDKAKELREKTQNLYNAIKIKNYRDLKIAHNDKPTLLGSNGLVKHDVTTNDVTLLIDTSIHLMIDIKSSLPGQSTVSVPVNLNDKYENAGNALVKAIGTIRES